MKKTRVQKSHATVPLIIFAPDYAGPFVACMDRSGQEKELVSKINFPLHFQFLAAILNVSEIPGISEMDFKMFSENR